MHLKSIDPFKCFYCANSFQTRRILTRHVINCHFSKAPTFGNCFMCGEESFHIVKHTILYHSHTHCEVCFKKLKKHSNTFCHCLLLFRGALFYYREIYCYENIKFKMTMSKNRKNENMHMKFFEYC